MADDRIVADLARQFGSAGVVDPEHTARKAAEAGLRAGHTKTVGEGRYVIFRADDADRARRFLFDDLTVDERLLYFVVETPDGCWGTDCDGLYLEKLRPWQKDVARARCDATVLSWRLPSITAAARGAMDNFVAELRCGLCGSQWRDGVRYQDVTAVRCPGCKTVNRVDGHGSTVTLHAAPQIDGESVHLPVAPSPLTIDQLAQPRKAGRRLVGLVKEHDALAPDLSAAQRELCKDRDHLDALLISGAPAGPGLDQFAEIRAIGFQLDCEGGHVLMQRVHDTLDPAEVGTCMVVSYLWDRIGDWRD